MKMRPGLMAIRCLIACAVLVLCSTGCGSNGTANTEEEQDQTATPDTTTQPAATQPAPPAQYWVSTEGSDDNPGSETLPLRTLSKAAEKAYEDGKDIFVVPGTYEETSPIAVRNGTTIRGLGTKTIDPLLYRPVIDFSNCPEDTCGIVVERTTSGYETTIDGIVIVGKGVALSITDASPTIVNSDLSTAGDGNKEIAVLVTAAQADSVVEPLIEDNTLSTGDAWSVFGQQTFGIAISNAVEGAVVSPNIVNNTIGTGGSSSGSYGISVSATNKAYVSITAVGNTIMTGSSDAVSTGVDMYEVDSAFFSRNIIIAGSIREGSTEPNSRTEGMRCRTNNPAAATTLTLQNNVIYGGDDAWWSYGIATSMYVAVNLSFNTIHAGRGTANTTMTAIMLMGDTEGTIRNNIICNGTGGDSYGIYELGYDVNTLKNNLFCNSLDAIYVSYDGVNTVSYTDIATLNGSSLNFEDNIEGEPIFFNPANHDYRLTSTSDAIDGGVMIEEIAVDLDEDPRPNGTAPDIGAYEYP